MRSVFWGARHRGASVLLPAHLSAQMRRTLLAYCPDLSDDALDALWDEIKRHRLRTQGDRAEHC